MDLIKELAEKKYAVIPGFLTKAEVEALCSDFEKLRQSWEFKKSGTGKKEKHLTEQHFRTDETSWFEPENLLPGQDMLWKKLHALKEQINRGLLLGLWELEGHFAVYGAGGYYQKHLDTFSNDDARTVSMVVYLNEDWKKGDGGELKIYDGNAVVNLVEPVAGTLVCFLSKEVPHEVLRSEKERKSFAGWFKIRAR